jgi:hypothetical protein
MSFSIRTIPLRTLAPWLALATIYIVVAAVLRSPVAAGAPRAVGAAVAIDLCATAAFAVWFFGVRRQGWPRWSIGLTAAIGALAAHALIPDPLVGRVLLVAVVSLELGMLLWTAIRLRDVVRTAHQHRSVGPIGALSRGLETTGMPAALASVLATEVVAVGYGVFGWLLPASTRGFSTHRRRGWTAIALILLGLLTVETVVLHLLLARASVTFAWILTGLSIYGALWIAADLHLLRRIPHTVDGDTLRLRFGIRWRGDVPLGAITRASLCSAVPADALRLTLLGANVLIETDRPIRFVGPYGLHRTTSTIALTLDQPEAFLAAITQQCGGEADPASSLSRG